MPWSNLSVLSESDSALYTGAEVSKPRQCGFDKELRFKSCELTRSFLRIAENAGEHFPDVVRVIKPLLRPVQDGDMFTYRIYRNPKDNEKGESHFAREYPRETLELLDAITGDDRIMLPYGFGDALNALVGFDPALQETPEYRRLGKLLD